MKSAITKNWSKQKAVSDADLNSHKLTNVTDPDNPQDAVTKNYADSLTTTDIGEGTNLYFTNERAEDAIGAILADSNTIDLTYDDFSDEIYGDVQVQMSLTSDVSGIKLDGDESSPGNSQYYGTDSGGTKGFHAIPSTGVSVPIGAVLSWVKSYTNTPALPSEFVECNGQVLSDADSPYDGQTIPNLNGNNQFLRGNSTSGGTGGSSNHDHSFSDSFSTNSDSHSHSVTVSGTTDSDGAHTHSYSTITDYSPDTEDAEFGTGTTVADRTHRHNVSGTTDSDGAHTHDFSDTSSTNSDSHSHSGSVSGTSGSSSNLPDYYNVVWVMRIK